MYAFLAFWYFVGLVIALRIVRSPVGTVLRAIRDNPLRAAAVGHNIHAYKLTAFVIAAAYAGFAGGLLGVMQGFMPPDAFMFDTSGQLIMQTAIGGAGTLFGPLVGASLWLFLSDFLQGPLQLGSTWKLVLGVVFVLLVCFLRHGIVGGLADLVRLVRRLGPAGAPAPEADTLFEGSEDCTPTPMRQAPVSHGTAESFSKRRVRAGVSAASWQTATSISGSVAASCWVSSVRTARARPRSSRCSPARYIPSAGGSCSKAVISPASMSPRSVSSD